MFSAVVGCVQHVQLSVPSSGMTLSFRIRLFVQCVFTEHKNLYPLLSFMRLIKAKSHSKDLWDKMASL